MTATPVDTTPGENPPPEGLRASEGLIPRDIPLPRLSTALRDAWDAGTSSDPGWSPENPARGQSVPTALIAQDTLGGALWRVPYEDPDGRPGSHYFLVVDGDVLDLTVSQFAPGTRFGRPSPSHLGKSDLRLHLLEGPGVRERYHRLRSRVFLGGLPLPVPRGTNSLEYPWH